MEVFPGQVGVPAVEFIHFRLFPAEGPDHPDPGEVFPGGLEQAVQGLLDPGEQRDAPEHDSQDHHQQQRNCGGKDQGTGHIDGKGHDHGTEHDEGTPEQQPQSQIQARLDLGHITGQPGDQGIGAQGIQFPVGQALDMVEQGLPEPGNDPHAPPGGKILGGKGKAHAQHHQPHKPQETVEQESIIRLGKAPVDHGGDHQGHRQIHQGFQQFEQGRQDAVPAISLKIGKKFFHDSHLIF